ncbi:hypothetical protein PROFUN_16468 [Planoprotostelium fungivorum]|uniref:Uncharacterized protein n=1 Tax=Planoprotostelium fungivorum TaxID=1890364 RepID=A0A2P6MQ05_9EUKA|nr:hypothetical protein PROFUN_16468 [Planoprotostelium fungivorum]
MHVFRHLLFLVCLWATASVADDCFFLSNCTLLAAESRCWNCSSGQSLPTAESTIHFASLRDVSVNLGSIQVKDIILRDSQVTFIESNVSSVNLNMLDSTFNLNNTTLTVEEHFAARRSQLDLSDQAAIFTNTATFRKTTLTFDGGNTFNCTSALFTDGTFHIRGRSTWNGHLNVSSSVFYFSGSSLDTYIAATSWTIRSTMLSVFWGDFTFSLPVTMINVTTSSYDHGLYLNRESSIVDSTIDGDLYCKTSCNVSDSTLPNIPGSSTVYLSGHIRVKAELRGGRSVAHTTIVGSSDLVVEVEDDLSFDNVTLIGPISSNTSQPGMASWLAGSKEGTITIKNTVIHGAWSFSGDRTYRFSLNSAESITGTSELHLMGSWTIKKIRGNSLTVDQIDGGYNSDGRDNAGIDTDRLIIGRLLVSPSYFIQLSNSTPYSIRSILLVDHDQSTLEPVRGGIPTNFLDRLKLESESHCLKTVRNSNLSVSYNHVGLYVTYVPPAPNVMYGWSDGIHTYLRTPDDNNYCTDVNLDHHDLLVVDADGQHRVTTYADKITQPGFTIYRLDALPDENGCTNKQVTVYLKLGDILSNGIQVDILPGDVIENQYYPWGNYNETDLWMGALDGEDSGKIRVLWNATRVPQPCGYKAELFTFNNVSTAVSHGNITLHAVSKDVKPACYIEAQSLPKLSIIYIKGDSYLVRQPYVPPASWIYPADYFLSLVPAEPSITPDDFKLTKNDTARNDTVWKIGSSLPSVYCPCGYYHVLLMLYLTNGTLILTKDIYNANDTMGVPYGEYVAYATGICSRSTYNLVGGYGRTIRREISLEQATTFELPRWVVPACIAGVLLTIIIIVLAVVIISKRKQRINYVQIQ